MKRMLIKCSLLAKGLLVTLLFMSGANELQAQSGNLYISNNQNCTIYVAGVVYDANNCQQGVICTTTTTAVPSGTDAIISGCSGAIGAYWHAVLFSVGCSIGPTCPPDVVNNPNAACGALPAGTAQYCNSLNQINGVWGAGDVVTF